MITTLAHQRSALTSWSLWDSILRVSRLNKHHIMAVCRPTLLVQATAAFEKRNIRNSWKRAKSNKFFTTDSLDPHIAWTEHVQLTQHRVRDEKKMEFTMDHFHMAFEWSNKTAQCTQPFTSTDIQHTCSRHNSHPWNLIKYLVHKQSHRWLTN